MPKVIKVYLDEHNSDGSRTGKRITVEAELLQEKSSSVIVKLANGNIITRKKKDVCA